MDKNFFRGLSRASQIQYIMDEGEIIHEIKKQHVYTSLFLLMDFYVEVALDERSNEVERISVQEDPKKLYPYVQHLRLTDWVTS